MNARTLLAGAALAALLAGCGDSGDGHTGGTPTGGTTSGASANTAALWRQFAECVRRHGMPNFPDPVQDADGNWGPPPNTSKPPQTTLNACRSIADRLPRRAPASAADMAKLRQLAQCMRRHGLPDWPDPNPDGSFPLPPRLRKGGKTAFGPGLRACRPYLINSRIKVSQGA
jgi:hypothetical protein